MISHSYTQGTTRRRN